MVIWNTYYSFGMLYHEKSGNPVLDSSPQTFSLDPPLPTYTARFQKGIAIVKARFPVSRGSVFFVFFYPGAETFEMAWQRYFRQNHILAGAHSSGHDPIRQRKKPRNLQLQVCNTQDKPFYGTKNTLFPLLGTKTFAN
jgi:hypothetical protein